MRRPSWPYGKLLAAAAVVILFLLIIGPVSQAVGLYNHALVIESGSMQHSDTSSYIGVVDTGDILLMRELPSQELVTYVDGVATGHQAFGSFGDVVIFNMAPYGLVVHRAICRLDYNQSGGFDVPSLRNLSAEQWSTPEGPGVWWNLRDTLVLRDVGYANVTVRIDLAEMLRTMTVPHGGLITMGDNNWEEVGDERVGEYDQAYLASEEAPLPDQDVVGRGVGEVPWFGLTKVVVEGNGGEVPLNSKVAFGLALSLIYLNILALPLIVWGSDTKRKRD